MCGSENHCRRLPIRVWSEISYESDISDQFRLAAGYVFLFLREAGADMPVQVLTKYAQMIKLKTAKALDLTVPPSVTGLCCGA
jgi:hypothetical protein